MANIRQLKGLRANMTTIEKTDYGTLTVQVEMIILTFHKNVKVLI